MHVRSSSGTIIIFIIIIIKERFCSVSAVQISQPMYHSTFNRKRSDCKCISYQHPFESDSFEFLSQKLSAFTQECSLKYWRHSVVHCSVKFKVVMANHVRACGGSLQNGESMWGKIVIVERGDCMFVEKARVLQVIFEKDILKHFKIIFIFK